MKAQLAITMMKMNINLQGNYFRVYFTHKLECINSRNSVNLEFKTSFTVPIISLENGNTSKLRYIKICIEIE